jgi:Sulfotransferase family
MSAASTSPAARPAPDPDLAPIFVVGSGRSGTTLLRLMLNAHPRIYLTHEASFYLTPAYHEKRSSGEEWLEWYLGSFFFAWLFLHPDPVLADLPRPLPRERLPDAYRAVMRAKARQYGRPRYGDKTPWHAVHLERIFEDFPDARVVHIVRDPRTAVVSFMRQPWGSSSYMLSSWFTRRLVEATRPFVSQILEVRLEDLLGDARATMGTVLDFVGEPWDDAVLDHSRHAPLDDVPPMPWYLPATEPRTAPPRTRKLALPPAWVRLIERGNRWTCERFGYERAALEHEPGFFERTGAFLADVPTALRFGARFLPGIVRYVRRRSMTPAEMQEFFFHLNPKAWRLYEGFELPDPPDWRAGDPRARADRGPEPAAAGPGRGDGRPDRLGRTAHDRPAQGARPPAIS